MSLRCKKGDLAIITRSPNDIATGQTVEVLDLCGEAFGQPNCWYVVFQGQTTTEDGRRYVQPDAWLLPIRPGDLKETEETEREVESVVS